MDINFENHILELLQHNECVILPGFGGFILKSIPSRIHHNTISPPSKQIAFNSSLVHDDELLTGALMSAHALAYETAKNKVLAFSNEINYTLKKESSYKLKKIGSFSVSESNRIVFKPFVVELTDKAAFGFQKFHLNPLPKEVVKKPIKPAKRKIEKVQNERQSRSRKIAKLPVVGLISSVLLLAGVIGLMGTNTPIAPAKTQQAGFVEMFFPNDSFINSFENTSVWASTYRNTPEQPKEGYVNERFIEINREDLAKGYYIIVGSYASRQNAERKEAKLFAEGKDSYIFPSDNGFYRVGVFADSNFLQAKTILADNYLAKQGAWMLKN